MTNSLAKLDFHVNVDVNLFIRASVSSTDPGQSIRLSNFNVGLAGMGWLSQTRLGTGSPDGGSKGVNWVHYICYLSFESFSA